MPFDFDPFAHLDINVDSIIDENDLKMWEVQHGDPPALHDLNHDGIPDKIQPDLSGDGISDKIQIDINQNSVIDKFEKNYMGTKFAYDLNADGTVDHLDEALARVLFPK